MYGALDLWPGGVGSSLCSGETFDLCHCQQRVYNKVLRLHFVIDQINAISDMYFLKVQVNTSLKPLSHSHSGKYMENVFRDLSLDGLILVHSHS